MGLFALALAESCIVIGCTMHPVELFLWGRLCVLCGMEEEPFVGGGVWTLLEDEPVCWGGGGASVLYTLVQSAELA